MHRNSEEKNTLSFRLLKAKPFSHSDLP